MGRLLLSWYNAADGATLSGGSWQSTLPLTNLQQKRLSKLARTTNAVLASTRFDIDFGATPQVLRLIGVMNHNMTQDARYRITGGATPGATTVDLGWQALVPPIYGLWDREFEHPDWYSGRISAAELASRPAKAWLDLGQNYVHRYWRVEFDDTANPAGYIQLTRLWFGPGWQPAINYDYGAALGWLPRDRAVETRSGARIAERLTPRRAFKLQLHELSDQEAMGRMLEMMLAVGSEGEVAVMPDPEDIGNYHRRNILARVANWGDGVVNAAFDRHVASLILEERL